MSLFFLLMSLFHHDHCYYYYQVYVHGRSFLTTYLYKALWNYVFLALQLFTPWADSAHEISCTPLDWTCCHRTAFHRKGLCFSHITSIFDIWCTAYCPDVRKVILMDMDRTDRQKWYQNRTMHGQTHLFWRFEIGWIYTYDSIWKRVIHTIAHSV